MNHSDDPLPLDRWQELLRLVGRGWPPGRWADLGVVVGCSGGADSVALVRTLCELRRTSDTCSGFIVLAHFDHGIRGREASEDAEFVRRLAGDLDIQFVTARATSLAGDESSMRAARSAFLRQSAQDAGARYVALAHSADDNVETVLHNLMRGTGPKGLAGMPRSRSLGEDPIGQDLVLIRPLLTVRRDLIRSALQSIGQAWREDSSNENTAYRRNWIRRELLPLMESQYPAVAEAVQRAARLQNEWKSALDAIAQQWIETHVTLGPPLLIRCDDATPSAVVIHALQQLWSKMQWPLGEMAYDHWKRLATATAATADQRFSLPGDVDVQIEGGRVSCRRVAPGA